MQRISTIVSVLATAFAVMALAAPAVSQTGEGWVTLLDNGKMGEWDRVGESNWRLEDGAVVADKRTGEAAAHLVSKTPYKDFQLHVEFWASDDANSGVFLRCQDPKRITDRLPEVTVTIRATRAVYSRDTPSWARDPCRMRRDITPPSWRRPAPAIARDAPASGAASGSRRTSRACRSRTPPPRSGARSSCGRSSACWQAPPTPP